MQRQCDSSLHPPIGLPRRNLLPTGWVLQPGGIRQCPFAEPSGTPCSLPGGSIWIQLHGEKHPSPSTTRRVVRSDCRQISSLSLPPWSKWPRHSHPWRLTQAPTSRSLEQRLLLVLLLFSAANSQWGYESSPRLQFHLESRRAG